MPNKTRKFTYPLLPYAFRNHLRCTFHAAQIADKINSILKEENSAITEITAYFVYDRYFPGVKLYFVIHSPPYPPDTHMVLPLFDNPLMEATFLDEDEQHAHEFLSMFYSIVYT